MWTFQLTMGQLASGKGVQPFVTPKDYSNWLVRLEGYLKWMSSAEQNMLKGMALGYVLPKSLIVKVLPQLKVMAKEDISSHSFFNPSKIFLRIFWRSKKRPLTIPTQR